MPRARLLPIGRLHRLVGRELATGCRSWRDSSLADPLCYCKTCASLEDTVKCTSTFTKAIAPLKDGLPAMKDFTYAPILYYLQFQRHAEESSPSEFNQKMNPALEGNQPMFANSKGGAFFFGSGEIKDLNYKRTIQSTIKKATNQMLPFVARRCFSSSSGSGLNSSMFGSGDKDLFLHNLECASKEVDNKLNVESLKAEFGSRFRPVFAANCLMLAWSLEHPDAAYLHGPVHGLSKNWPLYLSALDVMIRVKSCSTDQVEHLIDHIIQRRILIAEDWDCTYGNIEVLRYDPKSDRSFVRGECDAAFEKLNEDGSGITKVAFLIWKGSELIYGDVIEGIDCKDSVGAEILAGLALLTKCKDLGFQKVELWSDSKRVCGVLSGFESIYKNDTNRRNILTLRCMQTEFTELVPVFKAREIMFLTDHLLKLEGASFEDKIEKGMQKWSAELKGRTLFSITYTKWTSDLIKTFAIKRMNHKKEGYIYKQDHIFYWKVEKGGKFSALLKTIDMFCPDVLHLMMDRFEEKPANLCNKLLELFPACNTSGHMTTFTDTSTNGGPSEKRPLVVVWDSLLHKERFEQQSCVIVLIEDETESLLMEAANIKEINISTYLYLNRGEFKEQEKSKSSKGVNRSKMGQTKK